LRYELVAAMVSANNAANYSVPYTGTAPFVGAAMDPVSGIMTFTPNTLGVYTVAVKITDYNSNGVEVGSIIHETQFVVTACSDTNQVPDITNITNFSGSATLLDSNTIQALPGDSLCFDLVVTDPDATDTLSLINSIVNQLPGATVTSSGTNPLTLTICWVVPFSQPAVQVVNVIAGDGHCPYEGFATMGFDILTTTSVTVAGPDQTICPGGSATLAAAGGAIFTWSVLSGDPIVVGQNFSCNPCANPMASPSVTTTYLVTSNLAGSNTDSVTVTVLNGASVNLGPDQAFCQTVNAILDAGPGWAQVLWSTGDSTQTITAGAAGDYSVTVTDSNGCMASDTVSLILYPVPVVNLGPDVDACAGDPSVQLDAGPGWASILWDSGEQTQQVTVGFSGTYSVTVTDSNGCQAIDSMTLTYHPNPVVDLGSDTVICVGQSLTLDAGTGSSYAWSTGATTATINVSTSGQYSVTVTSAQGCTGSDDINVTVSDSVIIGNITTGAGGVLANSTVYLVVFNPLDTSLSYVDSTTTDSLGNYQFNTSDTCYYVLAVPDSIQYPDELPTYYDGSITFQGALKITISGCDTVVADFATVTTTPDGAGNGALGGYVGQTQGSGKTASAPGEPVVGLALILVDGSGVPVGRTLTNDSGAFLFNGLDLESYAVWVDRPFIDNGLAPTVTITSSTPVVDTLLFVLQETSLQLIDGTTGITEPGQAGSVRIFPNPTDGQFTLEITREGVPGNQILEVRNAIGQLVHTERWNSVPGTSIRTIDLTGQSKGMYFVRLLGDQFRKDMKLVLR
ncbi:MAG: T9SS type A sorting domain-containing protein, partial [Bacteroidota bacterium]